MNAEEVGWLAEKSDAVLTLLANLPHHGELEVLLDSASDRRNTAGRAWHDSHHLSISCIKTSSKCQ